MTRRAVQYVLSTQKKNVNCGIFLNDAPNTLTRMKNTYMEVGRGKFLETKRSRMQHPNTNGAAVRNQIQSV